MSAKSEQNHGVPATANDTGRPGDVQRLAEGRFLSLTTYRRSGAAVAMPVWVVGDGSNLLVWTGKNTGKAQRLRHTGQVTVAECNAQGKVRGESVPGTARLLPDDQLARVERLLAAKYRIGFPAMRTLNRVQRFLRRPREHPTHVGIEITVDARPVHA